MNDFVASLHLASDSDPKETTDDRAKYMGPNETGPLKRTYYRYLDSTVEPA